MVYTASPACHNKRSMGNHHHHPPSLLDNLRQRMPFWRKVWLVLSNSAIKIKNRDTCCGNYGQPGC